MSEVVIRWLTLVGTTGGTFAMVWAFGRRLFKFLSPLSELPQIKDRIETMVEQNATQHTENQNRMAVFEEQVKASNKWHDDHITRDHNGRRR